MCLKAIGARYRKSATRRLVARALAIGRDVADCAIFIVRSMLSDDSPCE